MVSLGTPLNGTADVISIHKHYPIVLEELASGMHWSDRKLRAVDKCEKIQSHQTMS